MHGSTEEKDWMVAKILPDNNLVNHPVIEDKHDFPQETWQPLLVHTISRKFSACKGIEFVIYIVM